MENLSGPELVKAVQTSMPGESIEAVLDKSREIMMNRTISQLKEKVGLYIIGEIEKLDYNEDDIVKILEALGASVVEFKMRGKPKNSSPPRCFPCWRRCSSGTGTPGTDQPRQAGSTA
jgi:hypothetical protein